MVTRALVVAVEEYPRSKAVSKKLPGAIANAEKFATCLESRLNVRREHILFCCSGESEHGTHGAKRDDVKQAVTRLLREGANRTDCLLVFLTGHGIMKPGTATEPHSDILLCSDFESSDLSGDACLAVDELTTLLARALGAGTHLCFVDACRTVDTEIWPATLGINPSPATSGTADRFHLLSATIGQYAPNDSHFIDALIACLNGESLTLVPDDEVSGSGWVTFHEVAKQVEQTMSETHRMIEIRSVAEKSDYRIRRLDQAGELKPILDAEGRKIPPVELLTAYEEVIFFGETNSQLAGRPRDKDWKPLDRKNFLDEAFVARHERRWKRLDIFSIEDLSTAGRPGRTVAELQQEREESEEFLRANAARFADTLRLFRYDYAGVYASLWIAGDGKRRAHVSARLLGVDIRKAQASDFIDFPGNRLPTVDNYFALVETVLSLPSTRCLFEHTAGNGA